ncbi:MAG: hypothetical protein GEEBNDBF_01756 [bacterium]|nr:hypothetical protein [bacterium]
MRTSPLRLTLSLVMWLIILILGCGGGGSNTPTLPDPGGPDPDTSGGLPGPTPDGPGGGGSGGGGGIPTTDADVRSGATDDTGVVTLPAFAKADSSSRAGKAVRFQIADESGTPLPGVFIVNIRKGNEFVGAIVPRQANRAPRFFFSQKIPDRVITADGSGEEEREAAILTDEFGTPVSSALNIAVEGNTIIVRLNLEADAVLSASTGIGINNRYFIDNDLLNRLLAFEAFASFEGVFNQAQLGNAVADALDTGGGYLYLAALVEEGGLVGNWQLGAALESDPNDPTYRKFLDRLSAGGTQNTYFQQQLAVAGSATKTAIRAAFDDVFGNGPVPANLRSGQRYLLVKVRPTAADAGYTGDNQNVLVAIPVAPRSLSLSGADGTPIFQVDQSKGLLAVADYTAGSTIALSPNPTASEGISSRVALTMTPFRPGDALSRPGNPLALTAVDELQRNLRADYFIPDYFGDPTTYPQNQLGSGCSVCVQSNVLSVVGPNGAITNLPPKAKITLLDPASGSGRISNGQLGVIVSASGTSDPDGNLASVAINWGDSTPETLLPGSPIDVSQAVNHTYTAPGTYTIRLTATDDGDPTGQATAQVQVTAVANANPDLCVSEAIPAIEGGEVRGQVPFSPEFKFLCSSDADSDIFATGRITIVFGDGPQLNNEPFANYTTVKKPYVNPGEYNFVATLKDVDGGTDTFTVKIIAEARPDNQLPIAVAGAEPTEGEAPLTVSFSSAGSNDPDGTITSYLWNFGDPAVSGGGVSILPNPQYTYVQPDLTGEGYTATLQVIDNSGLGAPNDRSSDTVVIKVNAASNLAPEVFITAPPVAEVNQPVQFSSLGSNDPDGNNLANYFWDFGDGNTSALPNPTHTYTTPPEEGFYFVTLQITDDGTPPRTGFAEAQIQVIAEFDEEQPFAIIEPQGPTFAENSVTVELDASASFSPIGRAISSYDWQFTDDGSTDTGAVVTKTFSTLGNHSVILTVTDEDGRTGATAIPIFVSLGPPFGLGARVVARATALPIQSPTGVSMQFFSTGTHDPEGEAIQIIGWDFGDGQVSGDANPMHIYALPGLYQVTMIASELLPEPDPQRFVSAQLLVRVVEAPPNIPPVALAGVDAYVGDAPLTVNFAADFAIDPDGTLSEESFAWDFGDGNADIGTAPSHTYADPGFYEVTLVVTDTLGASSQSNILVAVGPFADNVAPLIDIVPVGGTLVFSALTGFTLDLSGTIDVEDEAVTFSTDFGDGSEVVEGTNPAHIYAAPGRYTVTVQAQDESGGRINRYFDVLVAPA